MPSRPTLIHLVSISKPRSNARITYLAELKQVTTKQLKREIRQERKEKRKAS